MGSRLNQDLNHIGISSSSTLRVTLRNSSSNKNQLYFLISSTIIFLWGKISFYSLNCFKLNATRDKFSTNSTNEIKPVNNKNKKMLNEEEEKSKPFISSNQDCWSCPEYKDLPVWLQINDYITSGHRPQLPSVILCLKSMFRLHYDTLNIWTHAIGLCFPAYLLVDLYIERESFPKLSRDGQESLDLIVFSLSIIGPLISASFSTIYHIFSVHSSRVQCLTVKMDYFGVVTTFYLQSVATIYLVNYYDPKLLISLIMFLSLLYALTIFCTMSPFFNVNTPEANNIRLIIFTSFAFSMLFGGIICYFINGYWSIMYDAVILHVLADLIYALAVLTLACKVPERFMGKWNYLFHSHALMHVLVVFSAYTIYRACFITAFHLQQLQIAS